VLSISQGSSVGGEDVGLGVGVGDEGVGGRVGADVGAGVGADVGAGVGADVGAGVGAVVGLGVAEQTSTPQKLCTTWESNSPPENSNKRP